MKGNKSGVEQSYAAWISALKRRYRATQIKAAQNGWSRNSLLNWLSTDLYYTLDIRVGGNVMEVRWFRYARIVRPLT